MSYQKHNFEAGAVLFASQLNDMDNQIEFLSNQGSSFSDDFKTALLNCFENVAWANENGQTYYDALYDSLYPDNMWFITNTLTGCVTSNNATSIFKNNSYVATITAEQGYTLNGATANIIMGGNDVTNLYYSSGSINIPNVTGNLVITVNAVSNLASISAVFTQGSAIIYDTDSLDTLRQYLTVTATYSDSSTMVINDYSLSGTLSIGTSVITVTYRDKTDNFNVTVSAGLDGIAYGSMTYRDIFMTNNRIIIGDFESIMVNDNEFHTVNSIYSYKMKMAGTPVQTTTEYNSYNHSLKAFGTTSQQMFYKSDTQALTSGSKYLVCAAVKVDRYVQGNAGVQVGSPINSSVDRLNVAIQRTTNGFEPVVGIFELTANRTGWAMYIGSYTSANCDTYVDDVVFTPLPSGMTQEEAETLYANYLSMRKTMKRSSYIKGTALQKNSSTSTTAPPKSTYRVIVDGSGRASAIAPIENNNNTYTVTDSSKYQINVVPIANNTKNYDNVPSEAIDGYWYLGEPISVSWGTTFTRNSPYVWIAIRKIDTMEFTEEELENNAEAVFTVT